MSSISTQNNSELDGQSNITHPGDQFPKANERKKGSNDNCLETAIPLICVAPTMKTKMTALSQLINTTKALVQRTYFVNNTNNYTVTNILIASMLF